MDSLVRRLREAGVDDVLETNVICYSTPMSRDLASRLHVGGVKAGREIFTALLNIVSPKVLIVHGSGTLDDLRTLVPETPSYLPTQASEVSKAVTSDGRLIVAIPSLAPPAFDRWSRWASEHLRNVATDVSAFLERV
jgi:hypothetical protein